MRLLWVWDDLESYGSKRHVYGLGLSNPCLVIAESSFLVATLWLGIGCEFRDTNSFLPDGNIAYLIQPTQQDQVRYSSSAAVNSARSNPDRWPCMLPETRPAVQGPRRRRP